VPLTKVREWAKACFDEHPEWPIFESQRRLIGLLRELDFEIYIVTASIKWAVEPLAARLGIDHNHVLGITTALVDGKVGMETVFPVTWRDGKAEGLLKATGGIRPLLASGNTLGDIALIATATHVQLALTTQNEAGGLFVEESKLAQEADARGWLRHKFRV
jgi:phosphoserine phosphatase